jgi:hypothetical protein
LTTSIPQHRKYSDAESFPAGYKSTILELFVKSLERWKDGQILDTGPVCQENIRFFARRMRRHYACDLFRSLHRARSMPPNADTFCKPLDFPPRSFVGIQLWDLVDHLDEDQAKMLVKRCYEMLRPAGLLMLISLEKKPMSAMINTFVVSPNYRVDFRLQQHLELPWYSRHNRALMSLLAEFNVVKSFRYHNGLREFLFNRPDSARG